MLKMVGPIQKNCGFMHLDMLLQIWKFCQS